MVLGHSRLKAPQPINNQTRERVLFLGFCIGIFIVLSRLFYWQIIRGDVLTAAANDQYERQYTQTGKRGSIYTADGHLLVTNQQVYRLFAQPQELHIDAKTLAAQLTPLVLLDNLEYQSASASAAQQEIAEKVQNQLEKKLSNTDLKWVSLVTSITNETKQKISDLKIHGVGFDTYEKRYYPEASMAAHLTGFVGKDEDGNDIGYFGIEGALEQELKARSQKNTVLADALGLPLPQEQETSQIALDGRDITLTIRRDLQHLAETRLAEGVEQYGARAGEVLIMDPQTGDILAMAALPKYDQRYFFKFPANTYTNPSLSSLYEPGSTFKTLTVAAGIDADVISPDTQCDKCSGPRVFGKYTIKTWNDEYHPGITMTEALAKSDNTAMIFIAEKLGAERFRNYLEKFGIGEALHIELQGDRKTPFPQKWGPVELATISFGQGVSTTTLQLARAIGAIANDGKLMRPRIIKSATDWLTGETITPDPVVERQAITPETAKIVREMMVESAAHGEAQWTASRNHWISGKTGTSQIPLQEGGGYEQDVTMASFVGFAPPQDPKFVMIVKLNAPSSSIWAAETAAPLWYKIANDLFLFLNMPPDREPPTPKPTSSSTPTPIIVGD